MSTEAPWGQRWKYLQGLGRCMVCGRGCLKRRVSTGAPLRKMVSWEWGRGGPKEEAESTPVDLFLRHGHLSLCACWQIARVSVLLPCLPPASPVTCSVLHLMTLRSCGGRFPSCGNVLFPLSFPFFSSPFFSPPSLLSFFPSYKRYFIPFTYQRLFEV